MPFLPSLHRVALLPLLLLAAPVALAGQEPRRSLDLTVGGTGISIGDSRGVRGVRLNFRDSRLDRVDGINVTLWSPYPGGHGDVNGVAVGLPLTGGRVITGLSLGGVVEAEERLRGVGLLVAGAGAGRDIEGIFGAGLGLGAGGNVRGIGVGGLGIGAGGSLRGVILGGLGAGAGGDAVGIVGGGLGAGIGGSARGLLIGGLGAAAGGGITGVAVGGLGVGTGGEFRGIGVGGLGVGTGGDATGIFVGGAGVGSGGTLRYLAIGGLGVGAPEIRGVAVGGLGVGGEQLSGVMVGGLTVRVARGGTLRGVGVSAFNDVRGTQQGLTIGLLNHTHTLRGVQVGVLNIARNNPGGRKVLPLVNWNFERR